MEHSMPARLIKEMEHDMTHEADPVGHGCLVDLIIRRDEGPVYEHGSADDVLPGYKTPVATVERDHAVVAHGKVIPLGHNQIAVLNMSRQIDRPGRRNV